MPSLDESNRISLKFKISEILFAGRDWGTTSPKHERNTSPKRSIGRGLGNALEDTTEDDLIDSQRKEGHS